MASSTSLTPYLRPADPSGSAGRDQRISGMLQRAEPETFGDGDRSGGIAGMRLVPVLGDSMEPTLRRGDFAFVIPLDRYDGEGIYATKYYFGGSPVLHRFDRCGKGRVRVLSDNPHYSSYEISLEDFRAMLVGKVVITAKVVDRRLLPDALRV